MYIDLTMKAIVLTKAEMKEALTYGTQKYENLQAARRDYPGFKTVEEKTKRNKSDFSNLDMKTIKAYVENHGSDEQKEKFSFISKRTINKDGEYCEAQPFFKIKEWFLREFPEIKQARKDYREKVLKIYEAAEAKAEALAA